MAENEKQEQEKSGADEAEKESQAAQEAPPPQEEPMVTLLGASRDPRTKAQRRMNRFPRRVFRLGNDAVIRPGRRVPMRVSVLAKHIDDVVAYVEKGVLRVMLDATREVSLEHLKKLRKGHGVFFEKKESLGDSEKRDGDSQDSGSVSEGQQQEEPPSETEKIDDETDTDVKKTTPPCPACNRTSTSFVSENDDGVQTWSCECGNEFALGAEDETKVKPVSDTAPETTELNDGRAEGHIAPLPEGWRDFNKKDLFPLFKKHGIPLPEKTSKASLVEALEAWEAEQVGKG